jgi:hypothetical protein
MRFLETGFSTTTLYLEIRCLHFFRFCSQDKKILIFARKNLLQRIAIIARRGVVRGSSASSSRGGSSPHK